SAYYRDPDGNQVETQIDCMSVEDSISFMASEAFAANPIGIDVDFERLIARRRSGESVSTIIDYATAGS
ncbi:MAG: biphenyl 2,3-dioxygenase, partial [Actinomycetota bacterium]